MSELLERLKRASRKSPRQIAARLVEMGRAELQQPWSHIYPRLVTERTLLTATGAASIDALWATQQRAPFFVKPQDASAWSGAFRSRYPDAVPAILGAADRVLRHEFDLLGSGPMNLGPALPWHTDFKSGREWPLEYSARLEFAELDRPTDVKTPWELSRCQHFAALGQAYWLTGDERYPQEFVSEVSDWIARNPWAHGVNWVCAMDVALRAVNWIWGFYFMSEAIACRSGGFRASLLRELYLHGEYIATHLERGDVNGNHYLCDGVGLVFLGTFFRSTAKGLEWLRMGRDIVSAEIFNQTSEDGVDFEKSTAYHRLVLEAFLTSHLLLALHGEPLADDWLARLERMLEYVQAYTKPDGAIPLIGDADDGRVQKLGVQGINDHRYLLAAGAVLFERGDFRRAADTFADEAFWLLGPGGAERFDAIVPAPQPVPSTAFADGGVYVLRSDRAHVIVDCGEVGMHGRGGHGHSDITSVEIWLDGMNLVTDCGAYLYTASPEWRNRFRSTAFHNVVQVDGEELNRLVSPDHLWQLRDDARPRDVLFECREDADCFAGSHTGYLRLDPPVLVTREVALLKSGSEPEVLVSDTLGGRGAHDLIWRFHLDPGIRAEVRDGHVRLEQGVREAWLQPLQTGEQWSVALTPGWVSPSYGVRVPSQVVEIAMRASLPVTAGFRFGLSLRTPSDLHNLGVAIEERSKLSLAAT